MLDLFHIAKPQGCDIQTFYGGGGDTNVVQKTWIKPRGVSNIYMMLIGHGGTPIPASGFGGGCGAVTVWYGAAQNVPDSLIVSVTSSGNISTSVSARFSNSGLTPTVLLSALGSNTTGTAAAMTANQFAASGFFQSIAGPGGSSGDPTASATTFLGSGGVGTGGSTGNYGYTTSPVVSNNGYFLMQPIIVGLGAQGTGQGGIGSGGGNSGKGGQGLVLIASW